MKCAKCGYIESRVIDSRPSEDSLTIRRRRECLQCRYRFTTYERIETASLFIIKRDGSREAFEREKIVRGVLKACEKRPVKIEDIESMVSGVESDLYNKGMIEIPSAMVGEMVMNRLKELDEVAYVRFASVYRQFKDIDTFMDMLQGLLTEKKAVDDARLDG